MNYRKIFEILVIVLTGSLIATVSHAQQLNKLTAKEKTEGWHLLFNGKNLKGWHSYLEKHPGKDWSVQDHSIRLKKSKKDPYGAYADLTTDQVYKNFDLKLEWKMNHGVDSGVMIYVHESPKYRQTYETGPEIQIADLFGTIPDSRVLKERSADIFGLIPVDTEQVYRSGNWNKFEIIADNGHLVVFQNGHKEIDTHLWNDHWQNLVANSKFKSMPGFAKFHKGHITLQGTEVKGKSKVKIWFRNIKIKNL